MKAGVAAPLAQAKLKTARHDLTALVDADRRRDSYLLAGAFQDRHAVAAAEGEPGLQGRREAIRSKQSLPGWRHRRQ